MTPELTKELIHSMRRIRSVEETIANRYSEQEMRCPTHLSSGQEGVAAVIGALLTSQDKAVSGHRAHAHYLAKGGDLNAMIAEIYGKVTGCARGKGGSMHLTDESVGFIGSTAIVGGTVPVGVGLAYAEKLKKSGNIVCIFLGDAVVETGAFYESINFAILKNLPVLFLCENNFYSVYSPLEVRQTENTPIHERIAGLGVKTVFGDGNQIEDTYEKLSQLVASVRSGDGPAFAEFTTYRWREHCGPNYDNDLGYRPQDMIDHWTKKDPIDLFETSALNVKTVSAEEIDHIQNEIEREVEEAFIFAKSSPFPEAEEAAMHVLSTQQNEPLE